jgi:hypothetical protein
VLIQQLPPENKIEIIRHPSATVKSLLDSPNLKRLTRTEPNTGKHQTILVIETDSPSILIAEEKIKKWLIDLGDFSASLDTRQEQLARSLTKLDQDSGKILSDIDSRLNAVEELTNFIDDDLRKTQLKMKSQLDEYDNQFLAIYEDYAQTQLRLEALQEVTAQKSAEISSLEEDNTTTPSLRSLQIAEYAAVQAQIIERLSALEKKFTRLDSLEESFNREKITKDSRKKAKIQQTANLQRRIVLTWLGRGGIVSLILAWTWWICVYKK